MIITILITVIVLGLLVFVHELGHFIMAKRAHMQVDEFGFGFPPRLVGVQRVQGVWKVVWGPKSTVEHGQTVYSLNSIPLGGFVKIVGENGDDIEHPNSFSHKSFFARLSTLLAGVIMNVILAWVLMSIGFAWGVPAVVEADTVLQHGARLSAPRVTILDVEAGSPAAAAGLHGGDGILQIDDVDVTNIASVQSYVTEHKGQTFRVRIMRGQTEHEFSVQSRSQPGPDEGPTGIALGMVGLLRYPWYYAPVMGIQSVYGQVANIFVGLYSLVSGHVTFGQLGGPAKIAQLTGQASQLGLAYVLQFTAFLSLNLAVFNVLPIPALDGGRVLFLIIEKIRGKKNNQTIEAWVNSVGFIALLVLILAVSVNDVRSFGGVGHVVSKLFGN